MIRFGWFRLLVRLTGIVLVGLSVPSVVAVVTPVIYTVGDGSGVNLAYYLAKAIAPAVQLVLGLYLLFGGRWIVQHCLRGIDTVCPICAYDLGAVKDAACPECGFSFRPLPAGNPPRQT